MSFNKVLLAIREVAEAVALLRADVQELKALAQKPKVGRPKKEPK